VEVPLKFELMWLGLIALWGYLAVLAVLCIYGLHRYFLVVLFWRVKDRLLEVRASPPNLPRVTVQLPLYNEPFVARRVIDHACRIDYPRELLEIQVLDDSTDETPEIVAEAVAEHRAQGIRIHHVRRADRTGYKAGALAHGLETAHGEFVAIFDADFVPPPEILRDTLGHFADERVAMVQCRWDHLNRGDSLLTQAQAILLDGHFIIEHTARNRTDRFMSFNGTAGVWRKSAITDAGGWSHDTLTEDLDLSYRAQLRGWKFVFLPQITAPAELPPEMNAFKAQQHRWTKGGAQTCVKLLPEVLRAAVNWRVKLEAFFHLTSGVVYLLMAALSVLIGPALLAKSYFEDPDRPMLASIFDGLLFFVGTGSALSFYIVSQRRLTRRWRDILYSLPGLLAIGVGIAWNNAMAALEGFFCRAGEFVRTPKFGAGGDPSAPRRRPVMAWNRRHWQAWFEIGVAVYLCACLAAFAVLFDDWPRRVIGALPFMGLFIFGHAYVGLHTILGRWAPRPQSA